MKYSDTGALFEHNPDLEIWSEIDYLYDHKDELLDTEFGKDEPKIYEMNNIIRNNIHTKINLWKINLQNIWDSLITAYMDIRDEVYCIDGFRHYLKYIRILIDFGFLGVPDEEDNNYQEKLKLITDQINREIKNRYDELYDILDDYDKEYNMEKFKFPYVILHDQAFSYFISKYLLKESIDSLRSNGWYKEFFIN